MRAWIAKHDTAAFLIVTFAISWPLWILSGALTRTPVRAPDGSWLIAQVGVFAPAFAGMAVATCVDRGAGRRALRTLAVVYLPAVILGVWIATRGLRSFVETGPWTTLAMIGLAAWTLAWSGRDGNHVIPWPGPSASRIEIAVWSALAAAGAVGLFLVAWGLAGATRGTQAALPPLPVRELSPIGVASALAMNLLYGGSLGEEPGWRGAWLPRLLRRHSPGAASLVISVWWALWHAPIDVTQGFGMPGVGGLVVRQVWTLPVTLLFTWVTLRAGGSLLAPFALHTSLNAIPDFVLGDPGRYERAMGLFFVLTLIAAVAIVLADSRLRREPAGSA